MDQLPQIYAENIHRWLPELLYYSLTTLKIAAVSFVLAVVFGVFFALLKTSANRFLRGCGGDREVAPVAAIVGTVEAKRPFKILASLEGKLSL